MNEEISYLSICGMLGYGYPLTSLQRGMSDGVSFLGADNGSTDPGPYYLGSGKGFVKQMQIRRDLEPALLAAQQTKVPLIIGSAGGAGSRPHVDSFVEILMEIAHRHELHFRLAVIYADIDNNAVLAALRAGKTQPCGPAPALTEQAVNRSSHLVAQMGTEPIIEALQNKADVIVVGRCCDTAIFAAFPMMLGFDPALAIHAAKIAECGAMCAVPTGTNDSLRVTLHKDHFVVEPPNEDRKCTVASVAGHSLYEQPNPEFFVEPEGTVDMSDSSFEPFSRRAIKVSGTRLIAPPHETLKLEGAALVGYRAFTLAGLSDPRAIEHLDEIEVGVRNAVAKNLAGVIDEKDYRLRFLRYGLDAVTQRPTKTPSEDVHEVGLLIEAIAENQQQADTVLSLARSTALHQPFTGRKATAGNLAFPFSPSDFQGGPVYEFSVYHLMTVDDQPVRFPIHYCEVK